MKFHLFTCKLAVNAGVTAGKFLPEMLLAYMYIRQLNKNFYSSVWHKKFWFISYTSSIKSSKCMSYRNQYSNGHQKQNIGNSYEISAHFTFIFVKTFGKTILNPCCMLKEKVVHICVGIRIRARILSDSYKFSGFYLFKMEKTV